MRRSDLFAGALLTVLVFSMGASSSRTTRIALARQRHAPIVIHHQRGSNVGSDNWSGYAITGTKGLATAVNGSWIVPPVTCPPTGDQYAAFWVGIDGYGSNTVEQIGTESDCVNGSPNYYAWYEFYPHWGYMIGGMTIQSGDVMSASVSADAKGTFKLTLKDTRNGSEESSFTYSTKMPNANEVSAECIAEAPWSGGVLPLANFGTVTFPSCEATIGGVPNTFVAASNNSLAITMENSAGLIKAQPLGASGNGFSLAWENAGP